MSAPKILLLSMFSPFFKKSSGGEERTLHLHNALKKCGSVDTILMDKGDRDSISKSKDAGILADITYRQSSLDTFSKYAASPSLTKSIQKFTDLNKYDLIVSRWAENACKINIPPKVKVIIDFDDAYRESSREFGVKSPLRFMNLELIHQLKRFLVLKNDKKIDGLFFISQYEMDRWPEFKHKGRILPNIPLKIVDPPHLKAADPKTILILGNMYFKPNKQGVDFFLKAIWPSIIKEAPDAKLIIAGAGSPSLWNQAPNCQAMGYVDDLNLLYEKISFTVVPIFLGGGSNVKVMDAYARGKPCVMTDFSYRRLQPYFKHNINTLVASNDKELVGACVRLLNDPSLVKQLAMNGHQTVRQELSIERFSDIVCGFVNEILLLKK